jgi:(1->4)-alpha-D-glucan 1-alpha-D-glucosylmutase
LPEDWSVDGTTGYEFLNLTNGLYVHPSGAMRLRRLYARVTGRKSSFEEECYQSKKVIMATTMASEVQMLAHRLNRMSERHPRSRDFTLNSLRGALVEIVASLEVYRTYLIEDRRPAEDVRRLQHAVSRAITRNPTLEGSVYRFIEAVVLGADGGEGAAYPPQDDHDRTDRWRFTERLQQFTASVFAKGVEDTAFYRYQPLLSLNEVGGDAGALGRRPSEFHASNGWRAATCPRSLVSSSTHDTKLGEDARARIDVLSERADEWIRVLSRWRRLARASRSGRPASAIVDPNDVYRCYQALVGTWPFHRSERTADEYPNRLVEYMRKSTREAKLHTSWLNQNAAYEAAVADLVQDAVARLTNAPGDDPGTAFIRDIARVGVVNSLAMLVLRMGAPGIVDIYQGAEMWDLNLVDPDNRRIVDFDVRRHVLRELEPLLADAAAADVGAASRVRDLLDDWPSGRIKLFVTATCLRLRRAMPDVFVGGRYEPVEVTGPSADHVVAYLRSDGDAAHVLVAVPRLIAGHMQDAEWPLGETVWRGTRIVLPPDVHIHRFRQVFTGERIDAPLLEGRVVVDAADVFRACPAAMLVPASAS